MRKAIEEEEENLVKILVGKATIEGILATPSSAKGVVLFAHGSAAADLAHEINMLRRCSTKQELPHY